MEKSVRYIDNDEYINRKLRHSNGQLKSEYNDKNGERHGLQREWDKDGKLMFELYYGEGIEYKSKEDYEDSLIANKDW